MQTVLQVHIHNRNIAGDPDPIWICVKLHNRIRIPAKRVQICNVDQNGKKKEIQLHYFQTNLDQMDNIMIENSVTSVGDPDPEPDPHVLSLPDPDPLVRGTDPDPFFSHKCVERTEIMQVFGT
jgi:hypothetical protein